MCRYCENPRLTGYNFCHCCQIKNILQLRKSRNSVIRGDLYVLKTPRGIKVGRSTRIQSRIGEVSRQYFGGVRLQLLAEYRGMGHLEPFVHVILNAFRIPQWREEFTCNLQTCLMAVDHVKAYEIFGRLSDLPPDPRMAARHERNGADNSTGTAPPTSADGGGTRGREGRSRSRAGAERVGSRAGRGASSSHADSEGEESA